VCNAATIGRRRLDRLDPLRERSEMDSASPNLDDIYVLLRSWAVARPGQIHPYSYLSQEYQARTGDWFEPHGTWDGPLGRLNNRLHATIKAPALSALVVLKKDPPEPGGGFWGSAPGVPARPRTDIERLAAWSRIVAEVHAYPWPNSLP
jgi:hypothetical protein